MIWITTTQAAKMLGYSRRHFLRKFVGLIPTMRVMGGNIRWLQAAVECLARDARNAA